MIASRFCVKIIPKTLAFRSLSPRLKQWALMSEAGAEATLWASLSPVEATAVAVALARWHGATGGGLNVDNPLYDFSFDAAIVNAVMPPAVQQEKLERLTQGSSKIQLSSRIAMRTLAIDDQLTHVLSEYVKDRPVGPHQVVVLGAGLDSRAWRLTWPSGTIVYEVDSGACEALKLSTLQRFPLRCERRVFIKADLTAVTELPQLLTSAGLNPQLPTVWLLEGLIGYLSQADGAALFRAMASMSPADSQVVMTAPPSVEQFERAERNGLQLHHLTREDSKDTLARLCGEGWLGRVAPGLDLAAAHGLVADDGSELEWQDQIYAERAL